MAQLDAQVKARLTSLISRFGETVTFTLAAGGSSQAKAMVSVLATSRRYSWFTSTESGAWTLPALVLRLAGESTIVANDTFSRDGRTFTVKKVEKVRVAGAVVETILMAV